VAVAGFKPSHAQPCTFASRISSEKKELLRRDYAMAMSDQMGDKVCEKMCNRGKRAYEAV
jgi:hypothetical protein